MQVPHPLAHYRGIVPTETEGLVGRESPKLPEERIRGNTVVQEDITLAVLDERDDIGSLH